MVRLSLEHFGTHLGPVWGFTLQSFYILAINPRLPDDWALTQVRVMPAHLRLHETPEVKAKKAITSFVGFDKMEVYPDIPLAIQKEDWAGGLHPTINP